MCFSTRQGEASHSGDGAGEREVFLNKGFILSFISSNNYLLNSYHA